MEEFLREVRRVLRPQGHFLYCDLRPTEQLNELKKELLGSEMRIIHETDITENIKLALDLLSAERKEIVYTNVPILLRNLIETFAGIRGTRIYNAFHDGTASYICATLKNTA